MIRGAIPQPFQHHQVLWELDQRPGLLAGEGAYGSPRVNALIQALLAAGAGGVGRRLPVMRPDGPVELTGAVGALLPPLLRPGPASACSRCRQPAAVASRTAAGEPVCVNCFRRDPANHEQCTGCGRTALVIRRETAGCCAAAATGRRWLPARCAAGRSPATWLPPGRRGASTARAGCAMSLRSLRPQPGGVDTHRRRPAPVRLLQPPAAGALPGCGKTRTVAARLPAGPLCSTCYRKHPASFQPCAECGTTEHLYHHGLCTRCACRQHLLSLLSHDQGGLHPHAEAIYYVLAASNPAPLLQWLTTAPPPG